MTISKKDIKLLLYTGGLILLFVSFYFVFRPQMKDNEKLASQVAELETQLDDLKKLEEMGIDYRAQSREIEHQKKELLMEFPAGMKEEDVILYASRVEHASDMEISTVTIGGEEPVWSDGNSPYVLYKVPTSYSYTVSYGDMKKILRAFDEDKEKKTLDSITMSYNQETGELAGSLSLDMYYLIGTDNIYLPEEIPGVSVGTDNIFGTISGGGAAKDAGREEAADENADAADARNANAAE